MGQDGDLDDKELDKEMDDLEIVLTKEEQQAMIDTDDLDEDR